jgi:TetR/AcrR family transcriptional regulator, copper-responsive repressor
MVQKSSSPNRRPRGRPRAYDPDVAIRRAIGAFWQTGYSGTSLDDLSHAIGMNRPSLYAAFGDKRDLYVKSLTQYWQLGREAMHDALADDRPLRAALLHVYQRALSMYLPAKGEPRGCFAIGTAATEAVVDAKIRTLLREGLRDLDKAFEARLRLAKEKGELSRKCDPKALAMLASAALHTIAIRARAGEPRPALEAIARAAVDLICAQ